MQQEIAHTQTPWENGQNGAHVWSKHGNVCVCGHPTASKTVGYTQVGHGKNEGLHEAVANARHIVQCVNAHEALMALATKVANLNPDAGEIGEGMLRQLVIAARRITE